MSKSTSQTIDEIVRKREEEKRRESAVSQTIDEIVRKREEKNSRETAAATAINAAMSAGLTSAAPALTALDVKPKVGENMATRGLGTAPALGGPAGLTVGTEQQVLDRKIAGKEAERKALMDAPLYSSDEANLNTANRISDIDSEIAELKGQKEYLYFEEDMNEIMSWPTAERESLEAAVRNGRQSDLASTLGRYDADRMKELWETYELYLNQINSEEIAKKGEEFGEKLGIFGVVPQVGAGILGTAGQLIGVFDKHGGSEAHHGTGRYTGADPYRTGTWLNTWASAVGKGAASATPEQLVDMFELASPYSTNEQGFTRTQPQLYEATRGTTTGKVIDTVGSGAYQVVSTAADTVARAYLGGKIFGAGTTSAKALSLGLAGVRSFNDSFNETLKKGGTDGQALVLGIINGGTEIATEYIPLDEWWKIAEGGAKPVSEMLKQAALQGAIEMTQEEIGFLATTMAEYAILREKSEFQVLKKDLIDAGYSPEKAEEMIWEEFGRQAAGVAATSFFSGSLSTAGAAAFQSLMPGAVIQQTTQEQGAQPNAQPAAQATQPFIAAENAPQTQAAPTTQATQPTVTAAQQTSTAETQESVPATETVPQTQTPLSVAQEHYRQNGAVTNSMAEAILADSEAVKFLEDNAELKLGGTKSQDRNAVKAAVARTVETAQMTAEGAVETITGAMADLEEQRAETVATDNKPAPETAHSPVQTAQEAQTEQATTEDRGGVTELDEAIGPVVGRSMEQSQEQAQTQEQVQTANVPEGMEHGAVGAAERGFTGGEKPTMKDSAVYKNTYANATDARLRSSGGEVQRNAPDITKYEAVSEKESTSGAQARTQTDEDIYAEYEVLIREPKWSGEDNDTAMIVLKKLMEDGDTNRHLNLARKQREQATQAGQLVQSFAKYTRQDAISVGNDAVLDLDGLDEKSVPRMFWRNESGDTDTEKFLNWKKDVQKTIMDIAVRIDSVELGDVESMRQIVRDLAAFRRTTAWLGYSSNLTKAADAGINKLDFETARTVAKAQLGQIPNDFKKTSAGQAVKSISIMNMLSSLVTINRNLVGNSSTGLMDAMSDSSAGRLADFVLGKFTGQRTVGNDIKFGKEYFRGAWDAACFASLCTELAVPMDAAEYTGSTRTFSPKGNLVTRFLSSYEMGLKYALEVTDKFFEGGTESAVKASLDELSKKTGLENIRTDELAAEVGLRRTYKDDRALRKASIKLKDTLNEIGTEEVGVGDVLMPFAGVPANVAQVGIDYSAGIVEGLGQMIQIAKDAKAGKAIDPIAQRRAATNFGRGVSGAAMIATFTALALKGAIKVFDDDDRDKQALEQSLGYSDAVWNLSASWRLLTGKDGNWKPDDIKINLGFLQPFNAQMYIGYALSQEDGFWNMVKAAPGAAVSGIAESIMDIPMFSTFDDLLSTVESFGEVDEDPDAVMDAFGELVGNVGTRAIPSWLRQTAQYIDPYYRDTSGKNALEKAGKQFMASIPGVSKMLPMKYDALGNPQLRYQEGDKVLGFFNTFISPGKVTGATADEESYMIADYLGQLSETLDSKTMYPDYQAPKSFSLDGEKFEMNAQQRQEYQRVYGEAVAQMYGQYASSEAFRNLPAETQADILGRAKTLADDMAKEYITREYFGKEYPDGVGSGEIDDLKGTVDGLVRKSVGSDMTGGVSDYLDGKTEKGMDAIGTTIAIYDSMSSSEKAKVRDEVGGRTENMLLAYDAGMEPEQFLELYEKYKAIDETEGLNATQRTNEWRTFLAYEREAGRITEEQKKILRDNMLYFTHIPGSSQKFDLMGESGMSTESREAVLETIDLLQPLEGEDEVSAFQKYEAIAGMDLTEAEIDAAMLAYMPDYNPDAENPNRTELKYEDIRGMGFTPEQYVILYDIYRDEKDIGGKGTKNRTIDELQKFYGITEEEAKDIYAILSGDKYKEKK